MYNVLIVDDQKSSRELMQYVVCESETYNIVGALEDADSTEDFCKSNKVDLILMDIHTAGKENGLKGSKAVKGYNKKIKIIIVTFLVQADHIKQAKEIKCEGFWYKDHSTKKLVDVMDGVMRGEIVYPDSLPVIQVGLAKASDFTKAELNVLKLKVNGYSHTETCNILGITRSTLNYHISNLKGKTGYDNLLKLAIDVSMKKFIISTENGFEIE